VLLDQVCLCFHPLVELSFERITYVLEVFQEGWRIVYGLPVDGLQLLLCLHDYLHFCRVNIIQEEFLLLVHLLVVLEFVPFEIQSEHIDLIFNVDVELLLKENFLIYLIKVYIFN
jgi:hypothetical protein